MPGRGLGRPAPPSDITSPNLDEIRAVLLQFFQDHSTSPGPSGVLPSQIPSRSRDMSAQDMDELRALLRQFVQDHTAPRDHTEASTSHRPADGRDVATQNLEELRELLCQFFEDHSVPRGSTEGNCCIRISYKSGVTTSQLPTYGRDMSTQDLDEIRDMLRECFDCTASRGLTEEAGATRSQLPCNELGVFTQNLDELRAHLLQCFHDHSTSSDTRGTHPSQTHTDCLDISAQNVDQLREQLRQFFLDHTCSPTGAPSCQPLTDGQNTSTQNLDEMRNVLHQFFKDNTVPHDHAVAPSSHDPAITRDMSAHNINELRAQLCQYFQDHPASLGPTKDDCCTDISHRPDTTSSQLPVNGRDMSTLRAQFHNFFQDQPASHGSTEEACSVDISHIDGTDSNQLPVVGRDVSTQNLDKLRDILRQFFQNCTESSGPAGVSSSEPSTTGCNMPTQNLDELREVLRQFSWDTLDSSGLTEGTSCMDISHKSDPTSNRLPLNNHDTTQNPDKLRDLLHQFVQDHATSFCPTGATSNQSVDCCDTPTGNMDELRAQLRQFFGEYRCAMNENALNEQRYTDYPKSKYSFLCGGNTSPGNNERNIVKKKKHVRFKEPMDTEQEEHEVKRDHEEMVTEETTIEAGYEMCVSNRENINQVYEINSDCVNDGGEQESIDGSAYGDVVDIDKDKDGVEGKEDGKVIGDNDEESEEGSNEEDGEEKENEEGEEEEADDEDLLTSGDTTDPAGCMNNPGKTCSKLPVNGRDMSTPNLDELRVQLRQFFRDHTASFPTGATSSQPQADDRPMSVQNMDEIREMCQMFQGHSEPCGVTQTDCCMDISHKLGTASPSQLPLNDRDMSVQHLDELRTQLNRCFKGHTASRDSTEEVSCNDISEQSEAISSHLSADSCGMSTHNLNQMEAVLRQFVQDHSALCGSTSGACCSTISHHEVAASSRQPVGSVSQVAQPSRQFPTVLGRDMATQTEESDTIHGQTGVPTINEVIPTVKLADIMAQKKQYVHQMYEGQPKVYYNKTSISQYLTAGTGPRGITGPDMGQTGSPTGSHAGCSHWHTTSSQSTEHLKTMTLKPVESRHHLTMTRTVSTQTATISAIEAASLCLGQWWQSGHITDPQSQPHTNTETLTDIELIQMYMNDLEETEASMNGEVDEDMDVSDVPDELSNDGSFNAMDIDMDRQVFEDGFEEEAYQTEATDNENSEGTDDDDDDEGQLNDDLNQEHSNNDVNGVFTGPGMANMTPDGIGRTSADFLWYNREIYGQIFRDIYPTARRQDLLKSPKTTPWSVASREPSSSPGQPVSISAFINAGRHDTTVGEIGDVQYQTQVPILEPHLRLINNINADELIQGKHREMETLSIDKTGAEIGAQTMNYVFGEYRRAMAENALNEQRYTEYAKSKYSFLFEGITSTETNERNTVKKRKHVHFKEPMDTEQQEHKVKRDHEEMVTEQTTIEADYEMCDGNREDINQIYDIDSDSVPDGDEQESTDGSAYGDVDDIEDKDEVEEGKLDGEVADDNDNDEESEEGSNEEDGEEEEDDEGEEEEGDDEDEDDEKVENEDCDDNSGESGVEEEEGDTESAEDVGDEVEDGEEETDGEKGMEESDDNNDSQDCDNEDEEDDTDGTDDNNDDAGDCSENVHDSNNDSIDDSNNGENSNNTTDKDNDDTNKNDGKSRDNNVEGGSGSGREKYENNGEQVIDNEQQLTGGTKIFVQCQRASVTNLSKRNGTDCSGTLITCHGKKRKSISPLALVRNRLISDDEIHAYSAEKHGPTPSK